MKYSLGFKQKELIRIGEEKGYITVNDLRSTYIKRFHGLSAVRSLEILGYFKKQCSNGLYYWKYLRNRKTKLDMFLGDER